MNVFFYEESKSKKKKNFFVCVWGGGGGGGGGVDGWTDIQAQNIFAPSTSLKLGA